MTEQLSLFPALSISLNCKWKTLGLLSFVLRKHVGGFYLFWLRGILVSACIWDLVPWPGIVPTTPASHRECRVLPTGPPREVPPMALLIMKCKAKVFSKMETFDLNLPKGKDVSHGIDWSQLRSMKEQQRECSRKWSGSESPCAEGKAPEEMFLQQNYSGARCRGAQGWS